MQVRDANTSDIDGIVDIYNDAVANTTAIWNEMTIDAAYRAAWLADRQRTGYPVLVAFDELGRDQPGISHDLLFIVVRNVEDNPWASADIE